MDLDTTKKICSFCGDQGRHDVPLLGGRVAGISRPEAQGRFAQPGRGMMAP